MAASSGINTFTINNLTVSGNYTLRFVGLGNADVQVDDISWTGYSGGARLAPQGELNSVLNKLHVYPNPASHKINLTGSENGKAFIYSTKGELVMTHNISWSKTLDISTLSQGVYLIKSGNQSIRLLKR